MSFSMEIDATLILDTRLSTTTTTRITLGPASFVDTATGSHSPLDRTTIARAQNITRPTTNPHGQTSFSTTQAATSASVSSSSKHLISESNTSHHNSKSKQKRLFSKFKPREREALKCILNDPYTKLRGTSKFSFSHPSPKSHSRKASSSARGNRSHLRQEANELPRPREALDLIDTSLAQNDEQRSNDPPLSQVDPADAETLRAFLSRPHAAKSFLCPKCVSVMVDLGITLGSSYQPPETQSTRHEARPTKRARLTPEVEIQPETDELEYIPLETQLKSGPLTAHKRTTIRQVKDGPMATVTAQIHPVSFAQDRGAANPASGSSVARSNPPSLPSSNECASSLSTSQFPTDKSLLFTTRMELAQFFQDPHPVKALVCSQCILGIRSSIHRMPQNSLSTMQPRRHKAMIININHDLDTMRVSTDIAAEQEMMRDKRYQCKIIGGSQIQ
ncbi:hypothetical protein SISSUDRAFT_1120835 [Sistotremastrum suecicum HHB10207 ss-3]|uniref:Uncharacterized protein n=1 Tax=Sistotremastrum suecicum HHB10207 ss-3 TaxID=1314776 RepID=A0A166BRC0_9AGAM|nr:hypothetical protein SISSUDRAFT_1120835 [Sistotremastrum suecicum HHB10207 ss-3]